MSDFRGRPRGESHRIKHTQHFADHLDDTAHEAEPEPPPILKLGIGLFEVLTGFGANVVQVTTSTQAFVSMAEGQGVRFLNIADLFHAQPFIFTMAVMIACAIQGFLHMNAQSMSSTYARIRHIQHFNIKSPSSRSDVLKALQIKNAYFILSLVGDVVGDATFARMYTEEKFFIGAWIIGLTGCSTLLLYDGVTRIWGAWEDFKDYRAYHRQYDSE
jgi:hypothetical protein